MDTYKYINPNHMFEEDEDVDDYIFVSTSRTRNPPLSAITMSRPINIPYEGQETNLERRRILGKQREIEQRTLKSSVQSIQNLRDTENVGIATTKELVQQGGALNNTNRCIDEINANLNSSQKNINGIQSVIQKVINHIPSTYKQRFSQSQVSFNSRSDRLHAGSKYTDNSDNPGSITGVKQAKYAGACNRQDVNQMLDQNLDEMAHAIARLKNMGVTLGQEIKQQNDLVDVIRHKVEGTDIMIGGQITHIKKLQKK